MKGIVTSIQSMCWEDGPGLRTTVFLKGCPLRCFWCHNPESLSPERELAWYAAKCVGCGSCAAACPTGARKAPGLVTDAGCTRCGACAEACPAFALEVFGREWESAELAELLRRDEAFFADSGGGVTLSGGEPLRQGAFALELLRRLGAFGIHTAIETSGFAPEEVFCAVTDAADLVIMDLKHADDAIHRKVTGVSNGPILRNFDRLARSGKPCVIRTPVVPGVNDTEDVIRALAARAARAKGLVKYELMPYHRLGEGKLACLGREAKREELPEPPDGERMARLNAAAAEELRAAGKA